MYLQQPSCQNLKPLQVPAVSPDLDNFNIESMDPTPENVAEYDLLLLVTDHKKFDYQMFKENAQLIVDTRGVYQEPSMNIVKA